MTEDEDIDVVAIVNGGWFINKDGTRSWRTIHPYTTSLWVWNGEALSLGEFARRIYGDTPEATAFILKNSTKRK